MLKHLSIKNYALIEESAISFQNGFIVITGETGAGKSILLGALGLVLGNRAEADTLFDKNKKCVVEALFHLTDLQLESFFSTHDLDFEDETLIRREINTDGKSRAFINDTPVTLSILKDLSQRLIDVHSQHQTLLLNQSVFQFKLLDSFAQTKNELQQYTREYAEYITLRKKVQELKDKELQVKKELDFLQFQFEELNQFLPIENEFNALEQESEMLENAELIKSNLFQFSEALNGDNENIINQLSSLKSIVAQLSRFGQNYADLNTRLTGSILELKDLAAESSALAEDVNSDSLRLNEINDRLDHYNRFFKKHGVSTDSELIAYWNEIERKISIIDNFDEDLTNLEKQLSAKQSSLAKIADLLSGKRKKIIPEIEDNIMNMLELLAMPNARYKIELSDRTDLSILGKDEIRFLFSANKGNEFKELDKVASGGELSRLMLCLKALAAQKTALPTIIFDEIDTGVSGDIAGKIGLILQRMGERMQVISITHLPQIAAKGSTHLFVYKQDFENKTVSRIKTISAEERINEIAKMLSSGIPGEAALNNAKEMLEL